ncbi:hypothetical protein C8R44DRAFT_113490 [Mycena epipterygia]|nr:hypothetical protein C8R44DRAFT_113490 [Mycena epipterygia]
MPASIVPPLAARDPARHAAPRDWSRLQQPLRAWVTVYGRGGGLRGRGDGGRVARGGGRGAGAADEGAGGGEGQRGRPCALTRGTVIKVYALPSAYFNPPQLVVVLDCAHISDSWVMPPPAPPLRTPSPELSPPLQGSGSTQSEPPDSSSTPPSSWSTPYPAVQLVGTFASGPLAEVAHGTLYGEDDTEIPVVFKSYGAAEISNLAAEAAAYSRLEPLQGREVAAQIGILAPWHWGWGGLLMENIGVPLGDGGRWDVVEPAAKRATYTALRKIHEHGILHGDVAPRNVVRRTGGGIVVVDFGSATEHCCPGEETCRELVESRRKLL